MAEEGTLPQVLQLVLDLACFFAHLPNLISHWVPEVAINLDYGFHDEFTAPDDIES